MIYLLSSLIENSTTLAVLVVATVWIAIYAINGRAKKYDRPTPPFSSAGTLESIKGISGPNAPWFFLDMAKSVGSDVYALRVPIPGGITVVGDPTTIREVLLDSKSDKPEAIYAPFVQIAGSLGMFTRKSDSKWKAARKGSAHAFSSSEIDRMKRICSSHVEQWIEEKLEPCIRNGESFDPSKEMCFITFRVILESAFEYTQVTDNDYGHFKHHLEVGLREFGASANPLRKYYGPLLIEYRNALKSCREMQSFTQNILDAYRANKNKSKNKTIIRMIIENESHTSDKERIAEMLTMLIAGHDTTGFTLSTTIILLAKHPKVSQKLRQELSSMEAPKRPQSQYLKNVIKESKRLIPVAAFVSVRQTGRDISCKEGSMIIRKGTNCFMPFILPHRNQSVFKDPDVFRPERWEMADKPMHEAFMPFALGKRNCIGQSLAVAELYSVLPRLLAEYTFDVETEGELEFFLTLKYVGAQLKPMRAE